MNEYIYNLWPYLKLCNFAQNHANFSVFCHSKWTSALKVVLHTADMNDDEQKKSKTIKSYVDITLWSWIYNTNKQVTKVGKHSLRFLSSIMKKVLNCEEVLFQFYFEFTLFCDLIFVIFPQILHHPSGGKNFFSDYYEYPFFCFKI